MKRDKHEADAGSLREWPRKVGLYLNPESWLWGELSRQVVLY